MKLFATPIALCVWVNAGQNGLFEKQALSLVQSMFASKLDAELPNSPFELWFKKLIGPQAGLLWQLNECGERSVGQVAEDIPACAEANASLPDGSKVIVVITVGTFKKGLIGEPAFFRAFLERNDRLYQIRRLRDLPEMIYAPEILLISLPAIPVEITEIKWPSHAANPSSTLKVLPLPPVNKSEVETPDTSEKPLKTSEGVIYGGAISKVNPIYPANAKKMLASGTVEVQITISEEGRVIDARAISGHIALRNAAVEAARKWIFKPTMLDGVPIKIQQTLTFVFAPEPR
jgi:TonB family protein